MWYRGWFGNDILYMFLIWVLAAGAMMVTNRYIKSIVLLLPLMLIVAYAADIFAIVSLHSRFVIGGL